MMKLIIFACLLAVGLGAEIYYTPGGTYYGTGGALYARSAVVPLAYTHVHAPAGGSETYHSVQTPDSFQQQYRSDYKPLTYEYVY